MNISHLSIDLETLSLTLDAKIIQIGAYFYHPYKENSKFSIVVNYSSQDERIEDTDTLEWWSRQNNNLKKNVLEKSLNNQGYDLIQALNMLNDWIIKEMDGELNNFKVWSNGLNFDIACLELAYSHYNINNGKPLWFFRNVCDQRTIFYIASELGIDTNYNIIERNGDLHNASSDAEFQMKYILKLKKDILDKR